MKSPTLGSDRKTEIIQDLAEKLERIYVFPEVGTSIARSLRDLLARGEFDEILEEETLAQCLTTHLQEANGDRHLRVMWREEPLEEETETDDGDDDSEFREFTRLINNCMPKLERLRGNVGYMKLTGFCPPDWAGDTLVAAMAFLKNSSALVIDLRRCGDGDMKMVQVLCSYLFEESTHLNDFYWREDDKTVQTWTMPHLAGERLPVIPLFILTSADTFSAGEDFAYTLQSLGRAKVVGESTRGGAHPGGTHKLSDHLEVFIPRGRPTNPVTGTNWEGIGVTPDVEASRDDALGVAHALALGAVVAGIDPDARPALQRIRGEAQDALDALRA